MNIQNNLLRFFAVLAALAGGLFAASCSEDGTSDSPLALYYTEVSKIAPSMTFTVDKPSFQGPAPSEFNIIGITRDYTPVQTDSFTINASTGAVEIANTDHLELGVYRLSISCVSGGRYCEFPDVLVIRMIAPVPAGISVTPERISVPFERVGDIEYDSPTAQVTVESDAVTVRSFALAGTGSEYFGITSAGSISVKFDADGSFLPGIYDLDVVVTTYANQSATFGKAVRFELQSKPLRLSYDDDGLMETDQASRSLAPVLVGSPDGLQYTITKITPLDGAAPTDKITIDPKTGEILLSAGNALPVGAQYDIDVRVTNDFGALDVERAYHVTIVDYIAPISDFEYEPFTATHYLGFSADKKDTFQGGSVTFSVESIPPALQGVVSVDPLTGTLSTPQVQTPVNLDAPAFDIPVGNYEVKVRAVNKKSPEGVVATLNLAVVEHPNYFTRFSYGNNLGLSADEADQFRFATSESPVTTVGVQTNDFPAGSAVSYSLEQAATSGMNPPFDGKPTIDASTGAVTIKFKSGRANKPGAVIIEAVVGTGDLSVSRRSPVFIAFTDGNAKVTYTPFVLKVNPTKGGKSVQPVLDASIDATKFRLDIVRDIAYYNFNGPESHASGKYNDNTTQFLAQMWRVYYGPDIVASSYSNKAPLSWFSNESDTNKALLCYNNDLTDSNNRWRMTVKAGVWFGEDGHPASGFLTAQAPYTVDGTAPSTGTPSAQRPFPLMIWFDEKF